MIVAGILFALSHRPIHAQGFPGGGEEWTYPTNLNSWSFADTNDWWSDLDTVPLSFTNLNASWMGNVFGSLALELDSTNAAWLRYPVWETNGFTNLTVDIGTVSFWFAPNWASATTNENGSGPGDWGRLLEVGTYTTNAAYGWWSLFVDAGGTNLYFAAQTNSGDGNTVTYLSAPLDWGTNQWHNVVLTCSTTNTVLYVDGELAASGAAVTVWPGPDVLTNGFWLGSDTNGAAQARGVFDDLYTYDHPLDAELVANLYNAFMPLYAINIFNAPMEIASGPGEPAFEPNFRAVTGLGWLHWVGSAANCVTATNIWLTNVTATLVVAGTNVTTSCTFEIAGGSSGLAYDVFATAALGANEPAHGWAWLGQGATCNQYTMTNLPPFSAYLILGTPLDSDLDGLTDAYEKLVSQTDALDADTDDDGLLDGWEVFWGMNALQNSPEQASLRRNYDYDLGGWLESVAGQWNETVALDDEGNVQQQQ